MVSFADDLKKLAGDSLLVLIGKVGVLVGGFIGHTLLVRNLDPNIFGVLSLALTIVSVCAGFGVIGMNQAVTRFISGSDLDEANEYVMISISVALASGTLLALIMYTFEDAIESFFVTSGLANLLQILAVLIILRPFAQVILGITRGFELTRPKVISNDILPILLSLPVLYYFIVRGEVLVGAIVFYIIRPIAKMVLLSFNLHRWSGWTFEIAVPSREKFSEMFSFSWPLAFESLVVVFLGSVDILMLGWFTTSESVGLYRSIQPVSDSLIIFLQVLTFIYLPIATRQFEQQNLDRLNSLYKTSTRWVTHMTFPLFIFYLFFGEEFIRVVFQEEYVAAWSALAILSIGMYSRVVAGPNGMTIKAINRTREDLVASIGALLTNVVLNYLLIPIYGISGAAVATTAGYFVYNVVDLAIIYTYTGVTPFHWDLFTPFFPTVILTSLVSLVVDFQGISFLGLVLVGIGISTIHLLSIFVTTGLTQEDRLLINNIRNKTD